MKVETTMTTMNDYLADDTALQGTEVFKVEGDLLTKEQLAEIIKRCAGLKYRWNCLEKAKIVLEVLGEGALAIGSLLILSNDGTTSFGYAYEPPYEFHAWVELDGSIIDIALPGVINKGINTSDGIGPFVVGREEMILAGKPLKWMLYNINEVYHA